MTTESHANNRDAVELEKLRTEVSKLIAETGHVKMQTLVAPFLAAAAVIGATATATVALLNFIQ